MSFKNEVVSIGTTDTDIHEMGAGLEGAVVLGVGNTTGGAIATTIKFYKQSLGTTTTLVSSKSVAANDLIKIPVPIAMESGDKIVMSGASAGLRAFATVTDSSSIGSGGAWNPRGEYSAIATYAKRDVVYVPDDGVSYISLQDSNTGNTPSSQPSYWMVNADKGDPGADGELSSSDIGVTIQAYDAQLFSNIPQNSKSADYTLVLTDGGKHIFHPSADTTGRTFTIPANSSVAFPVGTAVTFINQNSGGSISIAITTDTMRLAGAGTTGSRTLAANGIATAVKVTSTEWLISGVGLS